MPTEIVLGPQTYVGSSDDTGGAHLAHLHLALVCNPDVVETVNIGDDLAVRFAIRTMRDATKVVCEGALGLNGAGNHDHRLVTLQVTGKGSMQAALLPGNHLVDCSRPPVVSDVKPGETRTITFFLTDTMGQITYHTPEPYIWVNGFTAAALLVSKRLLWGGKLYGPLDNTETGHTLTTVTPQGNREQCASYLKATLELRGTLLSAKLALNIGVDTAVRKNADDDTYTLFEHKHKQNLLKCKAVIGGKLTETINLPQQLIASQLVHHLKETLTQQQQKAITLEDDMHFDLTLECCKHESVVQTLEDYLPHTKAWFMKTQRPDLTMTLKLTRGVRLGSVVASVELRDTSTSKIEKAQVLATHTDGGLVLHFLNQKTEEAAAVSRIQNIDDFYSLGSTNRAVKFINSDEWGEVIKGIDNVKSGVSTVDWPVTAVPDARVTHFLKDAPAHAVEFAWEDQEGGLIVICHGEKTEPPLACNNVQAPRHHAFVKEDDSGGYLILGSNRIVLEKVADYDEYAKKHPCHRMPCGSQHKYVTEAVPTHEIKDMRIRHGRENHPLRGVHVSHPCNYGTLGRWVRLETDTGVSHWTHATCADTCACPWEDTREGTQTVALVCRYGVQDGLVWLSIPEENALDFVSRMNLLLDPERKTPELYGTCYYGLSSEMEVKAQFLGQVQLVERYAHWLISATDYNHLKLVVTKVLNTLNGVKGAIDDSENQVRHMDRLRTMKLRPTEKYVGYSLMVWLKQWLTDRYEAHQRSGFLPETHTTKCVLSVIKGSGGAMLPLEQWEGALQRERKWHELLRVLRAHHVWGPARNYAMQVLSECTRIAIGKEEMSLTTTKPEGIEKLKQWAAYCVLPEDIEHDAYHTLHLWVERFGLEVPDEGWQSFCYPYAPPVRQRQPLLGPCTMTISYHLEHGRQYIQISVMGMQQFHSRVLKDVSQDDAELAGFVQGRVISSPWRPHDLPPSRIVALITSPEKPPSDKRYGDLEAFMFRDPVLGQLMLECTLKQVGMKEAPGEEAAVFANTVRMVMFPDEPAHLVVIAPPTERKTGAGHYLLWAHIATGQRQLDLCVCLTTGSGRYEWEHHRALLLTRGPGYTRGRPCYSVANDADLKFTTHAELVGVVNKIIIQSNEMGAGVSATLAPEGLAGDDLLNKVLKTSPDNLLTGVP